MFSSLFLPSSSSFVLRLGTERAVGADFSPGHIFAKKPKHFPPLPHPENLPQVDDFLAAKNALFAALTEVDDLLDEVGCRLQREGEDLEIKLKAKAAEDAELRRKMATVAKRAEEMAERQEQHVKVILDLKKAYETEQAAHKRERDRFKAELAKLREAAEREVRETRDLRDREVRQLETVHKAARDDMIKLCNEGVASLADAALDVAVGGGRVRVEAPEMEDAVWRAFQTEINAKLHDWTVQYCTGEQRARLAAPPLRRSTSSSSGGGGGAGGAGKGVVADKSLPSTPSSGGGSSSGGGGAAGSGNGPHTPPTVSEGGPPSDAQYDSQ